MMRLIRALPQRWDHARGFGGGTVSVILVVLALASAAMISVSPSVGLLLGALVGVFVLTEYVLPPRLGTIGPLLIVFLTPADEMVPLSGDRRGFFVLIAGLSLALMAIVRGRVRYSRPMQLLIPGMASMYFLVLAIHASKGELRTGLFWMGALGLWVWLNGRIQVDTDGARRTLENALILIGAIGGAVGILEFTGVIDATAWIPGYEPLQDSFNSLIGIRAVGLSGHSLRLGSLCALTCTACIIRFAMERRDGRFPWFPVCCFAAAGAGLIASGARGSWLGLLCGLVTAVIATIQSRRLSGQLVVRSSFVALGIVVLVTATGLSFLVRERLVGTASAPASIGQRLDALHAIIDGLPELPFVGVGTGGAAEFLLRGGAIVPNIENEYLIALVTGGPLAMLALLSCCAVVIRHSFRNAVASRSPLPAAITVVMCVNAATFNIFSWSAGPPLFALVVATAVLTPDKPALAETANSAQP